MTDLSTWRQVEGRISLVLESVFVQNLKREGNKITIQFPCLLLFYSKCDVQKSQLLIVLFSNNISSGFQQSLINTFLFFVILLQQRQHYTVVNFEVCKLFTNFIVCALPREHTQCFFFFQKKDNSVFKTLIVGHNGNIQQNSLCSVNHSRRN